MNKFYTDETKTIMITCFNRISGTDADCVIPMGFKLNNQYSHYYVEVLDFYGNAIDLDGDRLGNLDAFDFMETNYNSHNHYNGQTIVAGIIFNGTLQYKRTAFKYPFICKNFNGKNIRFAVTKGNYDYTAVEFTTVRNWVLLLTVTPLKDTLEPIYYISSKKYKSFTYYFDTNSIISGDISNCSIKLNPIHDGYSEYFVDVRAMIHTRLLQTNPENFCNVYINNWSEEEESQFIGCLFCNGNALGTNLFESNQTADNAVFKIKNMKSNRIINLQLKTTENIILSNSFFLAGYTLSISCLITPIK